MPPAHRSLLCLTLACGPAPGDTDDSTSTTAGTTSTPTRTDATTTGTTTTGGCMTDETCPDDFGFVCLELTPGEGIPDFVFASTARVSVTLHYDACLTTYYETHPEQQADGPGGGLVFATWLDRLCSEPVDGLVACTVESFAQSFDGPTDHLTVVHTTPLPAQLAGGKLLWGPAPLPATAACADDLEPTVKLVALDDIHGTDTTGAVVWQLQSVAAAGATPALTSDACLQVTLAPI